MGWRSRILVVDDCCDTVEIISTLMRILGHECRGVRTGTEAIVAGLEFDPEIVLLDLVLPDISGYKVAGRLRGTARRRFYMAALTGLGTKHDRERTSAAGFDQHLLKPVDSFGLREVVARAALAQLN